jgi:hypothetical protein
MESHFIRTIFSLAIIISLLTAGCLKDDAFDNGSIQSTHTNGSTPNPVEIKLTAVSASNFLAYAIDNSDKDTVLDLVPVTLATVNPAPEDLHVTVSLDSGLVTDYNAVKSTAYAIPPSSMYTIVNSEVVIPKGSNTGFVQLKIKPSDFIGADWALGFKITAVTEPGYTISQNLSTGIVAIVIKNQYDGIYKAAGHFDHPVFAGDYNTEWECVTSGAASITFQLITTAQFTARITLTVNNDNSVGISSDDVILDPYDGKKNYYDPATRTFYLDFGYSGGTRHLVGTAVYDRPR